MDDKKKLFLYLLTAIGVVVVVIVLVFIVSLFVGNKIGYEVLETKIKNAAISYYNNHELPSNDGDSSVVSTSTLVAEGYLKDLSKISKDNSCTGEVKVVKNGENYLYFPTLFCTNYVTKTLKSVLTKETVSAGDGLYTYDNMYIYRGENVDNYIKFNDELWRILRIDETGIRMIKNEAEKEKAQWDNRYNVEMNYTLGINDYSVSRIKDKLNSIYEKYNDNIKKRLLVHSVCTGKRNEKDLSINLGIDCSQKDYGQYLGLITPSEYSLASRDKNCTSISSASCYNYNYLSETIQTSWTSNASGDNTYLVGFLMSYGLVFNEANKFSNFYLVGYLSNDELISSGKGTKEEPYLLK